MKKRNMTGGLVLLVFAVFMVSVLLVLLSGADTVQRLAQRDQRSYHHRTAVQYITTRVRQADAAGSVSTDNFGNINTLVLTEIIEDYPYQTRIYCCDGYLREMFCAEGAELLPEFGEAILPMENFRVTCEGEVIRITLSLPDGSTENMVLLLRSGGGSRS